MKKTLTVIFAAVVVAAGILASSSNADAQWRRHHYHRGPGVGLGILGALAVGTVIGAALTPRYYYGPHPVYAPAPGWVAYPGYAAVPGPNCYWARQPAVDPYGRVVGYRGRPQLFCS